MKFKKGFDLHIKQIMSKKDLEHFQLSFLEESRYYIILRLCYPLLNMPKTVLLHTIKIMLWTLPLMRICSIPVGLKS